MKKSILVSAMTLGVLLGSTLSAAASTSISAKPTHPTYVLNTKTCAAGYVKVAAKHKINGKTIKYNVCQWNPKKALAKKHAAGQSCAAEFLGVSTTGKNGDTIKCKVVKKKDRWTQTKAAPVIIIPPTTTTATAPPATTPTPTKTDPPTSVVVTSNDNPALVGDTVTYTVTVASVAIPSTTGQIELSDNGQSVSGCFPIVVTTYNSDGTFSGQCSVTYSSIGDATTENDTIVGIFTGDQTYAQSAGSMTETINAVAPVSPPSSGGGGGGGTPPPTAQTLSVALANTPYVQDSSDYLDVTYSAVASSSGATLPNGTLAFTSDGTLVCTQAVGGSTSTATCQITYTQFGSHSIVVAYTDTSGDSPGTTGVLTESIEPPAITIQDMWGTQLGTVPTATVSVIGTTASVDVTDANWEGPTGSVTATDNLGDSCTLAIVSTAGTCQMTVTGTPTSFTIAYPGGTSTQSTQSVAPNGTQSVTTTWPAESVSIANPTVTVQSADVEWQAITGSGIDWNPGTGHGSLPGPSGTITMSPGQLHLVGQTNGNDASDPYPMGGLDFSVSPNSGFTAVGGGVGVNSSSDCSYVNNYSNQADGSCNINFSASGTYVITLSYVEDDTNYASVTDVTTVTVDVT